MSSNKVRTYGSAAALLAAGLVAGGVLAGSLAANAADGSPTPPGTARHVDETPLTGDTLAKVKAAVTAKYPGATFDRVETDGETGAYEAHITRADGTRVEVLVSRAFAVTGEQQHRLGRPGGAGETALTGDTLAKVMAAVTAKYPGATFERVTTDRESGAYEAHITKADGSRVEVLVSKAFAVTGEEQHHAGMHRGEMPGGAPEAGSTQSG